MDKVRPSLASVAVCTSCGSPWTEASAGRFCGFCGASTATATPSPASPSSPAEPSNDPWIGRTVAGRFAIVRRLGEGGSGRVYLAEQAIGTARRRVALKMLLPEHASNPEMIARFSRECETVSVIEHTNVVRLYDFGETDDGALYIAMELVPGCSLGALIAEEGALEPRRALELFAQICRGVSAAHDRDIIHRDLKPDNLMVVRRDDEPEVVKVLDFGIAKTVGVSGAAARPLTRLGTVIGSPAYMSPEQLLGGEVDVRTDVYALGVVAYEMLTGVLPFDAEDIHGWAAQHISATPQSFDATAAGRLVSEPVRLVVERALAKNPADRPATVRELLRDLTEASRARVAAPVARPRKRRTRSATIARWLLVAVIAGGAGSVAALAAAQGSLGVSTYLVTKPPAGHAMQAAALAPARAASSAGDADSSAAALVVVHPVAPLPPVASSSRPTSKLDVSGCESALHALTCEDARAGLRMCPDAAGALHHRAHEHAELVCGGSDHPRSEGPPALPPPRIARQL
jgi:hypothetical protein